MEPFRSVRGGGARAWLAAAEASLLRSLVGQIMALVEPAESAVLTDPEDSELAALEAMVHAPGADSPPEDPVLARLLPDGYRDDPESAGEFRKYTEPALRSAKYQAAQEMLDTLPEEGGRIQLTQDQALAWLKALNDVRLALGVRLGVTEEFEDQWSRLETGRPPVDRVRGLRLARRRPGIPRPGHALAPTHQQATHHPPSRASPSRASPSRASPSRASPSRASPSRAPPTTSPHSAPTRTASPSPTHTAGPPAPGHPPAGSSRRRGSTSRHRRHLPLRCPAPGSFPTGSMLHRSGSRRLDVPSSRFRRRPEAAKIRVSGSG